MLVSRPVWAPLVLPLVLQVFVFAAPSLAAPPKPSANQLRMMSRGGLAQFMHFSVDPWSSIQHNCVGSDPQCIPASVFNPTNLSTDQWVEAAVAFGATEICLTAHHEGGFCLWDTQYTNYSVMHSPYGKDVVAQFVESCQKYNVTPCYYMGPNANGYLSNELKLNASEFVRRQLGMLHELLTNYGTDYVSRLWWDHYPSGCGGLAPCPAGSFPDAWPQFVELVRKVSPSTIICPGPDCDGHQSESGVGKYPVWYPCDPGTGDSLTCRSHAADDNLTGFHPYETCATMNNGWFAKGNGTPPSDTYWSPASIWDHYMFSVGIGFVNTLNAPPGTTGQIDQHLVDSMTVFGDALRSLLKPVSASAATTKPQTLQCGDSAAAAIELDLGAPSTFNSVITKEDLSGGQRIRSYAVDYFDAAADAWKSLPQCTDGESCIPGSSPTGHTVPPTPRGSCSQPMLGVNLVSDAPPSCKLKGTVTTAAACEALCKADPLANFWTWHDEQVTPPSFRGKCYCREDSAFAYRDEAHHVSGVCNHTLHGGNSLGVRGQSVGFNVIDWVPNTTASKVRFRCTSSMAADGSATVASFSVHHGTRPSE